MTNYLLVTILCFYLLGEPPDIDEGPFVPEPSSIMGENSRVKIGTPVYLVSGYHVTIVCDIVKGTPPVTISWFRNGILDLSRGNISAITVTDPKDGDIFSCRANNSIGSDIENSTIKLFSEFEI